MPCHYDEEKRGEPCPASGSWAAAQRSPHAIPWAMTGQGRVAPSPPAYKYQMKREKRSGVLGEKDFGERCWERERFWKKKQRERGEWKTDGHCLRTRGVEKKMREQKDREERT